MMLKLLLLPLSIGLLWPLCASAQPVPLPVFEAKPALADLDSQLYPLGWSKDGVRLAYLEVLPWEAGDAPAIAFRIVDLKTDKAVHEQTWDDLAEAGLKFDDRKSVFAAFWKRHKAAIEGSLEQHGIVKAAFKMHGFPAFHGERRRGVLNVVVRQKRGDHPLGVVGGTKRGVSEYSIDLLQDDAVKTVSRTPPPKIEETEKPSVYPLAINVRGFLVNKAEDRIALLVAVSEVGWEGPPHTRSIKIVGATIGEKF